MTARPRRKYAGTPVSMCGSASAMPSNRHVGRTDDTHETNSKLLNLVPRGGSQSNWLKNSNCCTKPNYNIKAVQSLHLADLKHIFVASV